MNKQLVSFQDFFAVLSRLSQGKGSKTFSHFRCPCGSNGLSGPAVDLLVRFNMRFIIQGGPK